MSVIWENEITKQNKTKKNKKKTYDSFSISVDFNVIASEQKLSKIPLQ